MITLSCHYLNFACLSRPCVLFEICGDGLYRLVACERPHFRPNHLSCWVAGKHSRRLMYRCPSRDGKRSGLIQSQRISCNHCSNKVVPIYRTIIWFSTVHLVQVHIPSVRVSSTTARHDLAFLCMSAGMSQFMKPNIFLSFLSSNFGEERTEEPNI